MQFDVGLGGFMVGLAGEPRHAIRQVLQLQGEWSSLCLANTRVRLLPEPTVVVRQGGSDRVPTDEMGSRRNTRVRSTFEVTNSDRKRPFGLVRSQYGYI